VHFQRGRTASQSQVITTFGPGALVDLPNYAAIVGGLEFWQGTDRQIFEERLIRKLRGILNVPGLKLSHSDWIFPADTHSGHIETGTLKKQHAKAITASGVAAFVPYDLRHTCLTRWARVMDPFTLKKLAGHTDLNTTMRYVHLNDDDVRAAMEKAQAGHKIGHNDNLVDSQKAIKSPQVFRL